MTKKKYLFKDPGTQHCNKLKIECVKNSNKELGQDMK